MKKNLFNFEEIVKSGQKAALCIIVETRGSSPRKIGSKMLIYADNTQEGTIGGGSLELKVIHDALEVIKTNKTQKFTYDLDNDLNMNCGGFAEVYIEPLFPQAELFIFGNGHIGKALAKYAPDFGFSVSLIDRRESHEISSISINTINQDYLKAAQDLNFNEHSYIVIVTPKHKYDEDVLAILGKKPFAYLGMIGSKNKIMKARQRMLEEKILKEKELDKVDMPIGIKFNAQTPEEIAISILAKMIDVKNTID